MEKVNYNQESYFREVSISNLIGKDESLVDTVIFPEDHITSVDYLNDLQEPGPRISLLIVDHENVIGEYKADGFSIIKFTLIYEGTQISLDFVISDIEEIEKQNKKIIYKIIGDSIIYTQFNSHIWYTSKAAKLSATHIIEELLKQATIPVIPPDKGFLHSSSFFDHIAPVNSTINENIDYLLSRATTNASGLYFLPYDIRHNSFKLLSINNAFQTQKENTKTWNKILIPSDTKMGDLEEMARNMQYNNYIQGISNFKAASRVNVINFDRKTRTWKTDPYPYKKIMSYFPGPDQKSKLTPPIIKDIPKSFSHKTRFQEEFSSIHYPQLGNRINKLFRHLSVLQFDCTGFIKREVGEIFFVTAPPQSKEFEKYAGYWIISRIVSKFSLNEFTQNISLIRPWIGT